MYFDPDGVRNVPLFQNVQTSFGAHSTSYSVGTGGLSPGVKRPGRDAEQSPLLSAQVKNEWSRTSCTATYPYAFMAFAETNLPLVSFSFRWSLTT
jgi:hypothetical protein